MKNRLFPPANGTLWGELSGEERFSPEFQVHLDRLQRFRTLLDHANDIILLVRLDSRRIVDANASACRQLRYPCETLVGMPVEIVVDFEGLHWPEEVGDGGECRTIVTELQRREGGRLPVEILLCMEEFGDVSYVVIVARDTTERKRTEEALRESDRMKSEFISTAAHELRTPLTSILGFSQILLGSENISAAERREFLAYIHLQAKALSDMVADLLDIARIESGQGLALRREFCTAGELVTQLAPFLQGGHQRTRFELTIASETAPLLVDKAKMAQVFENLLSNAVKYSPPGSPIRISGEIDGGAYRFSVADRGAGMTPEQVARVFDKFYRADASDTAAGGLGLGMSIVRNIVEAHGGRIWVESEPGRGTTAHFSLPLALQEASGKGSTGEEDPDRR